MLAESTECWGCLMSWPDDIEAGLPAPEQNEPPALRQDIVDELSDHLQCALNRELLNHPDTDDAESRVLARFGPPPQKLARQLWLDAMKETLMSNRLTLTFVAVLTAVCLTLCGMMWTQSQQLRELALQARAETQALLQQRDEANQKLLDQNQELLEKLTQLEKEPVQSPGWNPLKVRVVLHDENKTPGEGFAVDVMGKALTEADNITLTEATDSDGLATFGVVRPGQYQINVRAPWGESHQRPVVVRPGTQPVIEVLAPRAKQGATNVRPFVDWPEPLKSLDVGVVCVFRRSDSTYIDQRHWHDSNSRYVLFRQDGTMAEYGHVHSTDYRAFGALDSNEERVTVPLTFQGEPVPVEGEFPWYGESATTTVVYLVGLSPDEALPTPEETLPLISPSSLFKSNKWQQFYNSAFIAPVSFQLSFSIDKPDWKISIPDDQVREAVAGLASRDYPDEPAILVAHGMMTFLLADQDENGELSESEANESQRSTRIKFSEFPVTRTDFVTAYLSMRKSGSSGRSSPPPGFPGRRPS